MFEILFIAHAGCTLFLCGLIWFVQWVHYPLFARVGTDQYEIYQREHMRRTTKVVAIPMIAEAISGVLLLFFVPDGSSVYGLWMGLLLLVAIWLSTFFLQVPRHEKLLRGFDARAHSLLVKSNWLRVALWSGRACIVGAMAAQLVSG